MFKCNKCEKSFTTKQSLEYHSQKNVCKLKEEEFKCLICNKLFSKKQNLDYHVKNGVCSQTVSDTEIITTKMLEMYEMIKSLQQRVCVLENDNIQLKNEIKRISSHKIEEEKDKETKAFQRVCKVHMKVVKVNSKNGQNKFIFQDDDLRYATICSSINNVKTTMIWSRIDEDDRYQPLTENDQLHLSKLFNSFGLRNDNDKLIVKPDIYDKCIFQFGINLKGDKEEQENLVNEEEDEEEDEGYDGDDNNNNNNEPFFTRNESDGCEYFTGTTLKRQSMESYKLIYKNNGKNVLLREAPERFKQLWIKNKTKVIEYFNHT